jgi:hypothetical protein
MLSPKHAVDVLPVVALSGCSRCDRVVDLAGFFDNDDCDEWNNRNDDCNEYGPSSYRTEPDDLATAVTVALIVSLVVVVVVVAVVVAVIPLVAVVVVVGYRRFLVDLYWSSDQRDWMFCPLSLSPDVPVAAASRS